MDMQKVSSSMFTELGHDAETEILRVTYSNGGTYDYEGVSANEYLALLNAESIGKHFAKHIRSRKATKVPPPVPQGIAS